MNVKIPKPKGCFIEILSTHCFADRHSQWITLFVFPLLIFVINEILSRVSIPHSGHKTY